MSLQLTFRSVQTQPRVTQPVWQRTVMIVYDSDDKSQMIACTHHWDDLWWDSLTSQITLPHLKNKSESTEKLSYQITKYFVGCICIVQHDIEHSTYIPDSQTLVLGHLSSSSEVRSCKQAAGGHQQLMQQTLTAQHERTPTLWTSPLLCTHICCLRSSPETDPLGQFRVSPTWQIN